MSDLDNKQDEMPLVAHLIELRTRLMHMIGATLLVFFVLVAFRNDLYTLLAAPLRQLLPVGSSMVATDITSSFLAPFKLTFFVSFFIAIPYVLYQVWSFIAPALYKHEKKLAIPLLVSSVILFYIGISFAYFVTLGPVLKFFVSVAPENVDFMTDINAYLDFCIKFFLVFGFTFEIPVVVLILIMAGIISTESLAEKRRYIIVICFAISMFVTPPDALSMTVLAVLMWMLFEVGLFFGRFLEKKEKEE
ncbi:MAG TPA: twin-arginine translocase subunit TatC [Agitococcus sp.]|uniref:twin-arginine translocase subunit TatC n=1 Tax=uncultured Agitococcus sp. TaxID=1506599 RepID=UPI00262F59D0|nr:twin-arginine translocase subunit TatC [uncultured Agitococcus sp.]HNB19817.1 twin-arginine translocase subunit TatC [Agitococcus sp.]HRH91399.1 twin-arginine translocase subunit TatC [Agitococcus sp.]